MKEQQHGFTATAYFAALLALLTQSISSSKGIINKELAASVVYLLDLVTPYVPVPLLRSKFPQILTGLAPALTHQDVEAPLLRSSMGCLETLLIAQDSVAWGLPQTQVGPRRALAGLLTLAVDHRPKVRKRSQEALTKILKNPPPSPCLDHPAADLCAETALKGLEDAAKTTDKNTKGRKQNQEEHHPGAMHALQVVKTIAGASGGWPSRKIDSLCQILLNISKSSNEYLTMAAFEIFELIFTGMADEISSAKLPRLMEVISELRPSKNDSQLLPPWIAVISRGYDVSAQISPEDTFLKLPELFDMISPFLASDSHNIRISAAECMISFVANCIPESVILEPSIYDEKILEKVGKAATGLLSVQFQTAWMEVFNILQSLFEALRRRSTPLLNEVVKTVGELRGSDSFNGKKEADVVLGAAIHAMGPEGLLNILPLNLATPNSGRPGRAWLLPLLRDHVFNTKIMHFRTEFVPLSGIMYQRIIDNGDTEKTVETKIFETLVQQIWALLPGYCNLPLDLPAAFDQTFAEMISNLLYKQVELRPDVCRALQLLVDSNRAVISSDVPAEKLMIETRISKAEAQSNIDHLASFAGNLLAVLFNVYSQTLPQFRGYILQCINAYLSVTPKKVLKVEYNVHLSSLTVWQELMETFTRVTTMLEAALAEDVSQTQADKQKQKRASSSMPPSSHTLMDLIITLSIYLPRSCFPTLFSLAALILPRTSDPQLQKKAYKLIPRLANSPTGISALQERSSELQQLLLGCAASASVPARRDRLVAITVVVEYLPADSLHFIPSILSEVVISAKEVNEKARSAAFDLLVLMASKMQAGGTISQSQIPHMPSDAPNVDSSLEEFFTMVSAGLAGSTPHMISATITALTRVLYEFRAELPDRVTEDLVSTMDLFLTSNNQEIVRSVLGFVKVAIISLPEPIVKPRLSTLVPGLMGWSKEHKAHFRARVKHIFERMIRRFGFDIVNKYCPEPDKKLIHNIRKTKERSKRKKDASAASGMADENDGQEANNNATTRDRTSNMKRSRFDNEFDRAVYGSDDSSERGEWSSDDEDHNESNHNASSKQQSRNKQAQSYIVEDSDSPLDLLDRKSLANISSTKPVQIFNNDEARRGKKRKTRTDPGGKLIFGEGGDDGEGDDDAMMLDFDKEGHHSSQARSTRDGNGRGEGDEGDLEGGINAYVDAIKGKDAVQRGQGGRLKFSNRRENDHNGKGKKKGDEMDIDDAPAHEGKGGNVQKWNNGVGERNSRGGVKKPKSQIGSGTGNGSTSGISNGMREKVRGGRIAKSPARGGFNGRGRGRGSGSGSGSGSGRGSSRRGSGRGTGAVGRNGRH